MAEILLVSCPPWGVVMPPLGVACLAEYLRAEAITLQVQDLNLDLYERATAPQRSFWDFDTINRVPVPQIAACLHVAFGAAMEEFMQRAQSFPVIRICIRWRKITGNCSGSFTLRNAKPNRHRRKPG